jgi:hypothetical protein
MNRNYIASNILEIAILEMCRLKRGESFSPAEVVQWIYPQDWQFFLTDLNEAMVQMHQAGKIIVMQDDLPLEQGVIPNGPLRIKGKTKTS